MSKHNSDQWVMLSDQEGYIYWQRRSGDAVATVKRVVLDGVGTWRYDAGFEDWGETGYKDTLRSAKIAATKAMRWHALREQDYKRSKTKLRLLWASQGIESVEPVRGSAWDQRADKVVVNGILWHWQRDRAIWESGAWELWYNRATGWMLKHPDGYLQSLHVDNRHQAMIEAAFWIGRCLE